MIWRSCWSVLANNLFCFFNPQSSIWTWNLWQVKRQTALCSGQFYKRPLVNYICLAVRPPWLLSRYPVPSHSFMQKFSNFISKLRWRPVSHIWGIDIPDCNQYYFHIQMKTSWLMWRYLCLSKWTGSASLPWGNHNYTTYRVAGGAGVGVVDHWTTQIYINIV